MNADHPAEDGRGLVPENVPWGVPAGLAAVGATMLLPPVCGAFFGLATAGALDRMLALCAIEMLMLAGVVAFVELRAKEGRTTAGLLGLVPFRRSRLGTMAKVLALGALAYGAAMLGLWGVLRCLGMEWGDMPLQPVARLIAETDSLPVLAAAFAVVAVAVPVTEEVIFRGLLYLPLRSELGVRPAAVIVAVLFSAVHLYPWGALRLAVLSVVFVALFEVSGSLWPAIAAHGLYNGVCLVLLRLAAC